MIKTFCSPISSTRAITLLNRGVVDGNIEDIEQVMGNFLYLVLLPDSIIPVIDTSRTFPNYDSAKAQANLHYGKGVTQKQMFQIIHRRMTGEK